MSSLPPTREQRSFQPYRPTLSPFGVSAPRLLANGFTPLPIMRQDKRPGVRISTRWELLEGWDAITIEMLEGPERTRFGVWCRTPEQNVGVICGAVSGNLVAIDLDVDNPEAVALVMALPGLDVTKRGAKGVTRLFRYDDFDPVPSTKLAGVVDVISDGKYTVLPPSRHPKGMDYVWLSDTRLDEVEPVDLPLIGTDDLEALEQGLNALGHSAPANKRNAASDRASSGIGGSGLWREVNRRAMADLDAWVTALDIANLERTREGWRGTAQWRAGGTGQPLAKRKRNLRIDSNLIFDHGDKRLYSPIDLVAASRGTTADEALVWLMNIAGPDLPPFDPPGNRRRREERERAAAEAEVPAVDLLPPLDVDVAAAFAGEPAPEPAEPPPPRQWSPKPEPVTVPVVTAEEGESSVKTYVNEQVQADIEAAREREARRAELLVQMKDHHATLDNLLPYQTEALAILYADLALARANNEPESAMRAHGADASAIMGRRVAARRGLADLALELRALNHETTLAVISPQPGVGKNKTINKLFQTERGVLLVPTVAEAHAKAADIGDRARVWPSYDATDPITREKLCVMSEEGKALGNIGVSRDSHCAQCEHRTNCPLLAKRVEAGQAEVIVAPHAAGLHSIRQDIMEGRHLVVFDESVEQTLHGDRFAMPLESLRSNLPPFLTEPPAEGEEAPSVALGQLADFMESEIRAGRAEALRIAKTEQRDEDKDVEAAALGVRAFTLYRYLLQYRDSIQAVVQAIRDQSDVLSVAIKTRKRKAAEVAKNEKMQAMHALRMLLEGLLASEPEHVGDGVRSGRVRFTLNLKTGVQGIEVRPVARFHRSWVARQAVCYLNATPEPGAARLFKFSTASHETVTPRMTELPAFWVPWANTGLARFKGVPVSATGLGLKSAGKGGKKDVNDGAHNRERVAATIAGIAKKHMPHRVVVVATQAARDWLATVKLPANVELISWHQARGSNDYKTARALIILGLPNKPPAEMRAWIAQRTGEEPQRIYAGGRHTDLADEDARAWERWHSGSWITQAWGRLRQLQDKGYKQTIYHLAAEWPADVTPDEVINWKDEVPAVRTIRAADMLTRGGVCRRVDLCRVLQGDETVTAWQAREAAGLVGGDMEESPNKDSLLGLSSVLSPISRGARFAGEQGKFTPCTFLNVEQIAQAEANALAIGRQIEWQGTDALADRIAIPTSWRKLADWLGLSQTAAKRLAADFKKEPPAGWQPARFKFPDGAPVKGAVRVNMSPTDLVRAVEAMAGCKLVEMITTTTLPRESE